MKGMEVLGCMCGSFDPREKATVILCLHKTNKA